MKTVIAIIIILVIAFVSFLIAYHEEGIATKKDDEKLVDDASTLFEDNKEKEKEEIEIL